MSAPLQQSALRVVLYEGPGARPLEGSRRSGLLATLLEAGYRVSRPGASGEVYPVDEATVLILGEFDDGDPPEITPGAAAFVQTADITELSPENVLAHAHEFRESGGLAAPGEWTPWFPVIDYDRCTNCMQCLSFCLFDVYSIDDDDQITVQNEDNCKTNCPACSRVCPEVAILFPKYKAGPINGDVVREEDVQSESMKVDVSALLGGDIYSTLRDRQSEARERFSTERDESKALLERKRCLKELKGQLDIPNEVLMSLPSAGDIEERARRAREKMEQRLKRSRSAQDRQPAPTADDWGI